MSEALDAVRARKHAGDQLARACRVHLGAIPGVYATALIEPVPDDLERLAREAERKVKQ